VSPILLALAGVVLLLGWAAGSRAADLPEPCSCLRCWYVSDPPAETPSCPRVKSTLFLWLAMAGAMLIHKAVWNTSRTAQVAGRESGRRRARGEGI